MLNFFYRVKDKKGFTLIEVLVVVAIIGILAALATPSILRRIAAARISNDETLRKSIETAAAAYIIDYRNEDLKAVPIDRLEKMLEAYFEYEGDEATWTVDKEADGGAIKEVSGSYGGEEDDGTNPYTAASIHGRVLAIWYVVLENEDNEATGYRVIIDRSSYPNWHALYVPSDDWTLRKALEGFDFEKVD